VEPIEGDQQSADARRETQYTLLAEGIRFELPIDKCSHLGLLPLIAAVERSKIEIGGCVGDIEVVAVRPEKVCMTCHQRDEIRLK
jgi:hypothetical protein